MVNRLGAVVAGVVVAAGLGLAGCSAAPTSNLTEPPPVTVAGTHTFWAATSSAPFKVGDRQLVVTGFTDAKGANPKVTLSANGESFTMGPRDEKHIPGIGKVMVVSIDGSGNWQPGGGPRALLNITS